MASIDMGNLEHSAGVAVGTQASSSNAHVTVNVGRRMRGMWRRHAALPPLPPQIQNETLHQVQQGLIRALQDLDIRIDAYHKANERRWRAEQLERRLSLVGLAIFMFLAEASQRWGWW